MTAVIHVRQEYFLFDPHQEYLDPPLQGHRLAGGGYEEIEPDQDGALHSYELGMRLSVGEGHLQFVRLDTGERLLTRAERAEREAQRAEREAEARQREAQARQAAEAEVARLRAELARRPPPTA